METPCQDEDIQKKKPLYIYIRKVLKDGQHIIIIYIFYSVEYGQQHIIIIIIKKEGFVRRKEGREAFL